MVRAGLTGLAFTALLTMAGGALAQTAPTLPSMPPPPSFADPSPTAKAKKPSKRAAKANSGAANSDPTAFERPTKFVPAEFDGPRGRASGGATPMMTGSGRPGMGMKF